MHVLETICCSSIQEDRVVLKRILLIGAIVGILVSHGVVFYKIDTGVRLADANHQTPSGSRRAAYW